MKTAEASTAYYFNDFELTVANEPAGMYQLFENSVSEIQTEQLEIFKSIEKNAPFINASSFSSQVHFQNAYQTPVQRWFPYRQGYSIRLVNAFIKELKITGNVFDPFSGSGTTLLASRTNNLNSYGIDVNPISVLVAKVENEQYSKSEIVNFSSEIEKIKSFTKSNEIFPTGYINIDKDVWEKLTFPENKFGFVKTKLLKHLAIILFDLENNYGSCEKKPTIFKGSCLEFDKFFSKEIGFKVKNIFVTRHLTTSSQQKQELEFLRNYLRESIVLLEK